jgi:hypothetical protein
MNLSTTRKTRILLIFVKFALLSQTWFYHYMLRFFCATTLSLVSVLAGCATIPSKNETSGAAIVPYRAAVFDANPANMHEAFRAACDSPGDELIQPSKNTDICRFLPTPELAAYLLTEYDGRLEVPHVVLRKDTLALEQGVEVRISYFAEVVAKSGKTQKIYKSTPLLDRRIDTLLQSAGGRLN